jgi:hypothetical protein
MARVTVLHLVDHFVRLCEEVNMVAFENVVHEIVVNCHKQVGLFVELNRVPDLKQFLLNQSQVVLTLN